MKHWTISQSYLRRSREHYSSEVNISIQALAFWQGFVAYKIGEALGSDDASDTELINARSSFQEALEFFTNAGEIRSETPNFLENTRQWLANLEARIR